MKELLPVELFELAKALPSPIYVVGGVVRNFLMGVSTVNTDIDICGSVDISDLNSEQLPETLLKLKAINKKLGTCQINMGSAVFEYTRFRKEEYSGGNHVPESVLFHDSIELDALRRDFTINAIYYDVSRCEIVDVLSGISDINNKQIRVTTEDTFSSDGLRILRAVRFAAELGFSIEPKTEQLLIKNAFLLGDISPERKRDELNKILAADQKYGVTDAHYNGLKMMQRYGLFPYVIKELACLEGVKQNPKYHVYDVLEHTLQAVRFAPVKIRLAALMHDTGKPACLDGEGHMKGHNVVSEKITRTALGQGRLNYSRKVIEETARLCGLHMYDLKGETSDAKMRIFVAENFDIIEKLAALRSADGKATGMPALPKCNRFLHFRDMLVAENAPLSPKDLNISGTILEEYGIEESRRSEVLKELLNACIIDPKLNTTEWLTSQVERIRGCNKTTN